MRVASKFDAVDYDDLSNPSVMAAFYRRLFPAKQLYSWLNQDHGEPDDPIREWHDGDSGRPDSRLTEASMQSRQSSGRIERSPSHSRMMPTLCVAPLQPAAAQSSVKPGRDRRNAAAEAPLTAPSPLCVVLTALQLLRIARRLPQRGHPPEPSAFRDRRSVQPPAKGQADTAQAGTEAAATRARL